MSPIQYRKRRPWKYKLARNYSLNITLPVSVDHASEYIVIGGEGDLRIQAGYAWDGPSGPTIDSKNTLRASLIHDALYQLIRRDAIPVSVRKRADEILREICIEDGMWRIRAWSYYRGVRMFGAGSVKTSLLRAP